MAKFTLEDIEQRHRRLTERVEAIKLGGAVGGHGNSAHAPDFLTQEGYTKGDLVASLASGLLNPLPVGADGDVVTADAAASRGVKWNSDFNVGASRVTFGSAITAHRFNATSMTFEDLTGSEVFFFDATLMRIQRDLDLNGMIAIGDAPISQTTAINVDQTISPSSGIARAALFNYQFAPTAPNLESDGLRATIKTQGAQPMSIVRGAHFGTQHQGSDTLTTLEGGRFGVSSGGPGTITNAFGGRFTAQIAHAITMNSVQGLEVNIGAGAGSNINVVYGMNINYASLSGATITTGISIILQAMPTGPTNRYGISQEGAPELNWFRGATQFGGSSRPTSIGGGTSQLAIESTTKDFLPPRMTTAQVNTWLSTNPAAGGVVYDTTRDQLLVEETVNGVRRALEQRRWLSVRDFGATGDGSTDDITAINAAITAANAAGGGVVYFPENSYKTTTPIILLENVLLVGEGYGSTIRLQPAGNGTPIDCIQTTIDDNRWGVCNLHLQAGAIWTDANPAGAAIHVRNARQYYIGEIWIDGESVADRWSWGIYVDDDDNEDGTADGQPSRAGYYDRLYSIEAISTLANSAAMRMKVATGGWGHYLAGGGTLHTWEDIDDNAYVGEGDKGLWIEGIDGFRMVGYELIDFERCLVLGEQTASGSGINALGPAHMRFTDCAFEAIGTTVQDGGAVWADFASHVMFENCTMYGHNAAGAWEVFLDDVINNWFVSNCDIGIRGSSAGAIRLANASDYSNYFIRLANCTIGDSTAVDVGLRIEQDASNILVSNCKVNGAIGVQTVGTHAIALQVENGSFGGATPIDWQNTGGRQNVFFNNCLPNYLNTDLQGDTFLVKEDFGTGSLTSGQIGTHGWHFAGGTAGYDTDQTQLSGHPGILTRDSGTTINTECYTWMHTSFLFAGVELISTFDMADFFEAEYWARYSSTANLDLRIGISDRRNVAQPDDGIYFEHLAADANFFAVTRSATAEMRTDTTIAFDTDWHKLTIRRSGSGANIEFLIDGTVRATHTTNVMTGIASAWAYHKNTAAASKVCRLDSAKLRIPIFGR